MISWYLNSITDLECEDAEEGRAETLALWGSTLWYRCVPISDKEYYITRRRLIQDHIVSFLHLDQLREKNLLLEWN